MKKKVIIIAEAGVNHNGNFNLAKKLINVAARSGADIIKFQNYKTELLVQRNLKKNKKILKGFNPKKSFNLLKKFELKFSEFKKLKNYSNSKKIVFLATPFDKKSVDELQQLKVPFFKISSGDINNFELLEYVIKKNKHIILSTGRCSIKEIENTVKFLKKKKFKKYSLLHCVSEYPANHKDLNLFAIKKLKKQFKCKVGYSDHSKGIEAALAAVTIGAEYIEKHLTLDVNSKGPDHRASTEPTEFKRMVDGIRNLELALGSEKKKPTKSEIKGRIKSRRGIYATRDLFKNEKILKNSIICKRPAIGISAGKYEKVIGMKIKEAIKKDDPLIWTKIK
tara:strand:+ start:479 stop:1489 length:1011 start_codon:yes stop_codon:yes gene_type:complete